MDIAPDIAPTTNPFDQAIERWKKRYNIGDGDPMLASLELCQIFLNQNQLAQKTSLGDAVKKSLDEMNAAATTFVKQSGEVIQEYREIPKIKDDLWTFPYFTVGFATVAALIIGIFIGKFLF